MIAKLIPIDRLVADPLNVRKTPADHAADQELRASVRAHGVIHNLIVGPEDESGNHPVIAGGRRLLALKSLVMDGELQGSDEILCKVLKTDAAEGAERTELSLAENDARVALHPADQIEAFRDLFSRGMTPEQIANRFGYAERTVKQRLRLANVPQEIIVAYREGSCTLEAVQVLASAATATRALEAFERARKEAGPEAKIRGFEAREALDKMRVSTGTVIGQFIADEYAESGAAIDEDLFQEKDFTYLADRSVVEKLATEKLAAEAKRLEESEGWGWADSALSMSWDERALLSKAEPTERAEPTDEESARMDAIRAALEETEDVSPERWNLESELRAIESRIRERDQYPEGTGIIVTLDHNGVEVLRGLYRPGEGPGDDGKLLVPAKEKPKPGLTAKATNELASLRAHVIRSALTGEMATLVLTFVLALRLFESQTRPYPATLEFYGANDRRLDKPHYQPWSDRVTALSVEWADADNPWAAFLELTDEERDDVLAVSVGAMLRPALADGGSDALEHLAGNLGIDWSAIRPTAANYWKHMPKEFAIETARKALGGRTKIVAQVQEMKKKSDVTAALEGAFATDARTKKGREWIMPGLAPRKQERTGIPGIVHRRRSPAPEGSER